MRRRRWSQRAAKHSFSREPRPEQSCPPSLFLKVLAYPDLLPTGSVHVSEGGAQGRSAGVTAEFTPESTRLSPAACSTSIGVS